VGSITDRFAENLSAAREIRAFGLEQMEVDRFRRLSIALFKAQMKVVKYAQSLAPAIEIISAIGISITFIYAYRLRIPLESFLAIIFAVAVCYDPVKKLGALNNELQRGRASLERVEDILAEPVAIADPAEPVHIESVSGDIEFQDVSFAYTPGDPALRDISIRIPAGTVSRAACEINCYSGVRMSNNLFDAVAEPPIQESPECESGHDGQTPLWGGEDTPSDHGCPEPCPAPSRRFRVQPQPSDGGSIGKKSEHRGSLGAGACTCKDARRPRVAPSIGNARNTRPLTLLSFGI
jgi:hypothetical protein